MFFTGNIYTPSPSTIFFIDPVYLKQTTSLNENVDDKIIMESIQTAQDMYILPILGNGLYKQIEFEISGGTINSIPQDSYLLNTFIQPILAAATMMIALPFIEFQFKNKGIVKQKSDYSEPADRKDVEWMIEKYREKAAFYAQRLTQYLFDNTQIYLNWLNPQLGTSSSGADLFYPQRSAYNVGIYLNNLPSGTLNNEYKGWGLSVNDLLVIRGLI